MYQEGSTQHLEYEKAYLSACGSATQSSTVRGHWTLDGPTLTTSEQLGNLLALCAPRLTGVLYLCLRRTLYYNIAIHPFILCVSICHARLELLKHDLLVVCIRTVV